MAVTFTIIDQVPSYDGKQRKYQITLHMLSTSKLNDSTALAAVESAYARGAAHPVNSNALVDTYDSIKNLDSGVGKLWEVQITYVTSTISGSLSLSPLSRPPEISWAGNTYLVDIDREPVAGGALFQTSAGEKIDGLQAERGDLICKFIRNEADLSLLLSAPCYGQHIVNSTSYTLDGLPIPAKLAKLNIESAEKQTENGVTFYRITYIHRIKVNGEYPSDGWRVRLLDMGHYSIVSTRNSPKIDTAGGIVNKPQALDGAGAFTSGAPAVRGPWKFYPEYNFSPFGFI